MYTYQSLAVRIIARGISTSKYSFPFIVVVERLQNSIMLHEHAVNVEEPLRRLAFAGIGAGSYMSIAYYYDNANGKMLYRLHERNMSNNTWNDICELTVHKPNTDHDPVEFVGETELGIKWTLRLTVNTGDRIPTHVTKQNGAITTHMHGHVLGAIN